MKIKPFAVEEWMNRYEVGAKHNIAETCVDSVSADELFAVTGEDGDAEPGKGPDDVAGAVGVLAPGEDDA